MTFALAFAIRCRGMDRWSDRRWGVTSSSWSAFVASTAWLTPSSFSATAECRTSPGPPAPQGQHWYYRVDRVNDRYCWFLQPAAMQIHLHRTVTTPSPTTPLVGKRLSFSSLWSSPAAATAEVLEREPTFNEPVAVVFTARWLDLSKSVDLGQREFPASRTSYVAELGDRIEPKGVDNVSYFRPTRTVTPLRRRCQFWLNFFRRCT
jgi:hypothetical protein